jgi:ABC-type nickel/cobalt efflux system permease component RcnA
MITYLITGIIAAMVHVVSGPDHLAAVTPLAIESKKKSWSIGFSWGLGHTFGMLIIGILFILFKQYVNVDLISTYGEIIVGFLLIAIGLWAIAKIYIKHGRLNFHHVHPHIHDDEIHIHAHSHQKEENHTHNHNDKNRQNIFVAFGIGILHGIAGVSSLIAILPTLAFPSKIDSILYLIGFGGGTIFSMVAFSTILGILGQKSSENQKQSYYKYMRFIGGIVAITVGCFWIVFSL